MDKDTDKRGAWEDQWQRALSGADMPPPPRAWQGVERQLLVNQLTRYKKRAFWLQQMAAAAVVGLLLVSGYTLIVTNQANTNTPQLATGQPEPTGLAVPQNPTLPDQTSDVAALPASGQNLASGNTPINNGPSNLYRPGVPGLVNLENNTTSLDADLSGGSEVATTDADLVMLAALVHNGSVETAELPLVVPVLEKIRPVYTVATANNKEEKAPKKKQKLWLGISLAGNFFDPNYSTGPSSALNSLGTPPPQRGGQAMRYTANPSAWNHERSALPALNMQVDALFQIHNRWHLSASLGYGSFRSGSKMGQFTGPDGRRYPLHYANFAYDKLETVSANSRAAQPIDAVSNFSFIQVPLKLNYALIDRQFGLAPVLGINTQYLLNGSLTPAENTFGVEEYELENDGRNSPFRNMYFSGLVGLQLFYHTGRGTVLTLEPTYQRALTPLNRQSYLFTSEPTNLGISLGIRKRIK